MSRYEDRCESMSLDELKRELAFKEKHARECPGCNNIQGWYREKLRRLIDKHEQTTTD